MAIEERINVAVDVDGALSAARQFNAVAASLRKAGGSSTNLTAQLEALAIKLRKVSNMNGYSNRLYKSLFEQAKAFGLTGREASNYAQRIASLHNDTYMLVYGNEQNEKAALAAANAWIQLCNANGRFAAGAPKATLVLDGETFSLRALTQAEEAATAAIGSETSATDANATANERSTRRRQRATTTTKEHTRASASLGDVLRALARTVQATGNSFTILAQKLHLSSLSTRSLGANFRRVYGTMRALMFTALIFGGVFTKWFKISAEFAETNHLLVTTLSHAAGAVKTEAVAVSELSDEMQKYAVILTDVLDQPLDKALVYESEEIATRVRDALDSLKDYSYRMMLDPTALRKMYGSFMGMADAAGIASEQAIELSDNMTHLAVDLASLWDIDFEEAATKLRSALAGNTRAARALGIDVGRSAAAAWLAEKGYTASYNALSLADRMLVQYAVAMEGAAAAQGDLARSALQPANMFRFLAEMARKSARSIGNALFPVFTAFLPLIIMTVEALTALANRLSMFFSVKMGKLYDDAAEQWRSYANNLNFLGTRGDDEMEDLNESIDNSASSLGRAADAAKEFKKQLLGFDEINNLTEKEDKMGGGLGGLGGISVLNPDDLKFDYTFNSILGDVRTQIEAAAQNVRDWLSDTFGNSFISVFRDQHFADFFGTLLSGSWNVIKRIFGDMKTLFFGETPEDYERNFYKLKMLITTIYSGIVGIVWDTKKAIEDIVKETNLTWDDAIGFAKGFAKAIREIIGWLKDAFISIYNFMKDLLNLFGVETAEDFGDFSAKAVFVVGVLEVLKPLFSSIGGLFGTLATLKLLGIGGATTAGGVAAAGGAGIAGAAGEVAAGGIMYKIGLGLGKVLGAVKNVIPVAKLAVLSSLAAHVATKAMWSSLDNFKHFDGTNYTDADKAAYMTSNATGMITLAGTTSDDLKSSLESTGKKISKWWDGVKQTFKDKTEATKVSWQYFWGKISESSEETWQTMAEHPEYFSLSMKDAFRSVDESVNTSRNNMANYATSVISGFQTVNTTVNNSIGSMTNYGNAIVTTRQTVETNAAGMEDALNIRLGRMEGLATDAVNKTTGVLNNFISNNNLNQRMINVGKDFIDGFIEGVNNKINYVNYWLSKNFGNTVDKINDRLRIGSPSKVMAEVGEFFMEGFVVGVNDELPNVLQTVTKFATDALNVMKAGATGVADITSNQLSDELSSSVAAKANVALQTQSTDMTTYSQQEINLLREQNNLLTAILNKEFGVSLDGKQLAQSINYASRIQGRPLIAM